MLNVTMFYLFMSFRGLLFRFISAGMTVVCVFILGRNLRIFTAVFATLVLGCAIGCCGR